MYWECACGITNHVNSPVCAGCGWTKIKADKYKGGQFTKDDIENENRMILEAQRDEKIFIKKKFSFSQQNFVIFSFKENSCLVNSQAIFFDDLNL